MLHFCRRHRFATNFPSLAFYAKDTPTQLVTSSSLYTDVLPGSSPLFLFFGQEIDAMSVHYEDVVTSQGAEKQQDSVTQ